MKNWLSVVSCWLLGNTRVVFSTDNAFLLTTNNQQPITVKLKSNLHLSTKNHFTKIKFA